MSPAGAGSCGLLGSSRASRFLPGDETIEALDELITLGQVPPTLGDVEKIVSQLGVGRLARAPFRVGGADDTVGNVIARFVQHGTHQR